MQTLNFRFLIYHLSQPLGLRRAVQALHDFDERLAGILHRHIAVLLWWCMLQAVVAVPGLLLAQGALWYFMLMNLSWAIINGGIAVVLHWHIRRQTFRRTGIHWRIVVQRHVAQMLLLNILLDISYSLAGFYLLYLSAQASGMHVALWWGFGWSVTLQGLYLLLHDFLFYRLHRLNFARCKPFLLQLLATKTLPNRGTKYIFERQLHEKMELQSK